MPIRKIAFLGTGIMGAPMACHLARAGYVVTAWNRTPAKARALESEGVRVAAEPGEAVQDADAVITMLTDGAAASDVIFSRGCADAAPSATLFVDCSSIAPAIACEHADRLASLGHHQIDAPVSGGESGARAASLAIMAGGEEAVVAHALPVLSCLGRVTRVGPNGTGQLAKLANQAIVGITIAAVSEALLLTAASGADPAAFREAVSGGFASSRVLDEHGGRMIARDFVPGGRSSVHLKDMDNILAAAAEFGIDLPLCREVSAQFAALTNDMDCGDCDHSALLLWLEARNAPHRVGQGADRIA